VELQRGPDVAAPPSNNVGADDWKLRRVAVDALRRAASREDLEHLIQTLRHDHADINVLSSALQVLVSAEIDVAPALIELLPDADPNLRMHAALALGQLRSHAAVPALIAALGDADANVRFHAIEALGTLGSSEAVEPLAAIAEGGDFFLRVSLPSTPGEDRRRARGAGDCAPCCPTTRSAHPWSRTLRRWATRTAWSRS
jgi:hypothetical protein